MSDILFENDGKRLGTIRWPFKKYMILMPEKNDVDAFAWLFASFVRMYNRKKHNPSEFTYNQEIENVVKGQIRQHFGNIIDVPTLNKVIETTNDKYLDPDKHDSIKVFNNLFTDNLQIRYIFQDCITGSVVPFFYTDVEVESDLPLDVDFEGGLKPVKISKPAKKYVKLAYKRYFHKERYMVGEQEEVEEELDKEEEMLNDEDAQLFEDDDDYILTDEDQAVSEKTDRKPGKFDIKFLDDGSVVYYDIPISVEDNRLTAKTPFDISTNPWMNMCFTKGAKENKELKDYYDRYSASLVPEKKIDHFFEDPKDSIYNKLPNCANIYRAIEKIGDRRLRTRVWRLEGYYARKDTYFYVECTKILERLLKFADYEPSDREYREYVSVERVRKMLKSKRTEADLYHLMKDDLIWRWKNKYVSRNDKFKDNPNRKTNWKPRLDFKPDFLDLVLQTDLLESPLIEKESINDIWTIWSDRNRQGHDDEKSELTKVTPENLMRMEKSVRLLCQKVKGGAR